MIGLIGISYKSAPVEVREKFSFNSAEIQKFSNLLKIDDSVKGSVIVSTCNRVEIYFHIEQCCKEKGFEFIFKNLAYFKGYTNEYREYFYTCHEEKVSKHLFKVVSGIDSLVIGEDQIIGQVKEAFYASQELKTAGQVLTRLFQKAFETGKKVRSKTQINRGNASVSSAAITMCKELLGDLEDQKTMFVGAGQTGELAVQCLIKKGGKDIAISNRTHQKSLDLAKKYNAEAIDFNDKMSCVEKVDIVIVATGSKNYLITKKQVEQIMKKRNGNRQIYIDLSVPRNIEPEVQEIENVRLFGVDDLQEVVKDTTEKRIETVEQALAIIEVMNNEFNDWYNSLNLTPTIKKIKQNFHEINKKELMGYAKINGLKDNDAIFDYGNHITEKYTRLLIKNLKEITDSGKRTDSIKLVSKLFELA